ncbi:MAG: hypothetical protein LC105_05995 [Chitinophagales bacterium]|nr:hypothetical protein [Chitinophagales bacterium]
MKTSRSILRFLTTPVRLLKKAYKSLSRLRFAHVWLPQEMTHTFAKDLLEHTKELNRKGYVVVVHRLSPTKDITVLDDLSNSDHVEQLKHPKESSLQESCSLNNQRKTDCEVLNLDQAD